MTSVLLIRHGQASFGTDDYDRLSERGLRQAEITGRHLAAEGRRVARIVAGGLRRQRDTAHALADAFGFAGRVQEDPRLDEFRSKPMFDAFLQAARARVPELGAPFEEIRSDGRLYGLALREVTALWTEGEAAYDGETWGDFDGRTRAALDEARDGVPAGEVVVVCTSGGVIGASVSRVLGTGGSGAMALSRQTLNAGISELRFGRTEAGLRGFNSVAHLRLAGGEDLVTRR